MKNTYKLYVNSGEILTESTVTSIPDYPIISLDIPTYPDEIVDDIIMSDSAYSRAWEELELDSFDLSSTFKVDDLRDITSRKDSISTDIVLKGTQQNNIIFGGLYNIDRDVIINHPTTIFTNYVPNKYIACFLLENGIEVFRGKLIVSTIDVNKGVIYYNCAIVGETFSFFRDLSDFTLDQLDYFSQVSFNRVNNTFLYTNTSNPEGYPLIDYGGGMALTATPDDYIGWSTSHHRWDSYRPAIRLDNYIDAIFRGFRYDSDNEVYTQLDESGSPIDYNNVWKSSSTYRTKFHDIVVPNTSEKFERKEYGTIYGTKRYLDNRSADGSTFSTGTKDSAGYFTLSSFTNTTINVSSKYMPFGRYKLNSVNHFAYKSDYSITGKLNVFFGMNTTNGSTFPTKMRLNIIKISSDSTTFTTSDVTKSITVSASLNTGSFSTTLDLYDWSGYLVFAFDQPSGVTNNIPISIFTFSSSLEIYEDNPPIVEVFYNDSFNLYDNIPTGVKQQDFLKNVMEMFNLYLVKDPITDEYDFYSYDEFYTKILNLDFSEVQDWSGKVNFDSYKINSNLDLPKSYTFTYTSDDDLMNSTYSGKYNEEFGSFVINNSNGLADAYTLESIFSPTITLDWGSGRNVPMICGGDSPGSGEKTQRDSNIRLLYYHPNITCRSYYLLNKDGSLAKGSGTSDPVVVFSYYNYASMIKHSISSGVLGSITESIMFGLPQQYWGSDILSFDNESKTLYYTYFQERIRELIDPNLITVDFKIRLTEMDINNLDFRIPVKIDSPYGSTLFKLNTIEYGGSEKESTVTLQKIVSYNTNQYYG